MTFRPPIRTTLAALALLAVGLGVWNCAGAGEKTHDKVLLIGVDAGEWDVLGPLLDQQRLPAFGELRAHGASGRLRSLEPLTDAESRLALPVPAEGPFPIQAFEARLSPGGYA